MTTAVTFTAYAVTPKTAAAFANKHDEREARAKAAFAKGKQFVTFLGNPTPKMSEADEKAYTDGGGACLICGRTHSIERASLTSFYRNEVDKSIFALSDSCRANYFQVLGIDRMLTNPDVYHSVYPTVKKR